MSGILDFLKQEGRVLVGVAVGLIVATIIVVGLSHGGSLPTVTYGDVANLTVAIVAVTSLYIAWRELLRKTEPNVTVHFDTENPDRDDIWNRMVMKLTNSGANVITPVNIVYGLARRDGEDYYLTNLAMSAFDEDGLRPGETAEVTISENVVVLQLKNVNFMDWTGEGVSLERFGPHQNQVRLDPVEPGGDAQVKIQKLFNVVMDVPHQCGLRVSAEELKSSSLDELINEYQLDR